MHHLKTIFRIHVVCFCRPLYIDILSALTLHSVSAYVWVVFLIFIVSLVSVMSLILPGIAGSNVSAYIGMVSETLRISLPKAVVHCQVVEAKRALLNHFYVQIGKREVYANDLVNMLVTSISGC